MGPNALWLTEYLLEMRPLNAADRVMDLGCGRALSSIFLAREFGVQVWAEFQNGVPSHLQEVWSPELHSFHSADWWRTLRNRVRSPWNVATTWRMGTACGSIGKASCRTSPLASLGGQAIWSSWRTTRTRI